MTAPKQNRHLHECWLSADATSLHLCTGVGTVRGVSIREGQARQPVQGWDFPTALDLVSSPASLQGALPASLRIGRLFSFWRSHVLRLESPLRHLHPSAGWWDVLILVALSTLKPRLQTLNTNKVKVLDTKAGATQMERR